jgi:hypothetical protein
VRQFGSYLPLAAKLSGSDLSTKGLEKKYQWFVGCIFKCMANKLNINFIIIENNSNKKMTTRIILYVDRNRLLLW